jgi:hypothetical protein
MARVPGRTIKGNKNEAVKKSLLFRFQIIDQKSLYTENIQFLPLRKNFIHQKVF